MGFVELLLVSLGVSMDAFAVSLTKGLSMKKFSLKDALMVALFFGGFQALMPLIGWMLASRFSVYINGVGHWISFGLLSFIGGRMIYEACGNRGCPPEAGDRLCVKSLFILAVATSLDALAVGVSFAFLEVLIIPAVLLIGAVTGIISFAGVRVGNAFGGKLEKKAGIAGGLVLILIGLKIVLENMDII
ncbi:MAG: manganese efflux pump [Clostridiales bacterium]|nr:manganese efflux pump [Clostridiales bacterium]